MVDVVDSITRSRMMAGIRSKNTHPERIVRSLLHRAGYRFRLHVKNIPGRPDIVLPKYRLAIHVHGCFWHGHDCGLYRIPSTRPEFWKKKIRTNRNRDKKIVAETLSAGWRHLTIWECAFRGPNQIGLDRLTERLLRWIEGNRKCAFIRSTEGADRAQRR